MLGTHIRKKKIKPRKPRKQIKIKTLTLQYLLSTKRSNIHKPPFV